MSSETSENGSSGSKVAGLRGELLAAEKLGPGDGHSLIGRWGMERRKGAAAHSLALGRYYLGGHPLRARSYALMLAEQLRLPQETRETLSLAGYVFDAGALQIQDEIVLHPGPLNDQQQEAVRAHVFRGCSLVRESGVFDKLPRQLIEAVCDIVLFHHERYDGNGYPYGLKGEAIPYLARVMAVADAFSTMTSKRPHREARSTSEALGEIERGMGTQFDPELASTFIRMVSPKKVTIVLIHYHSSEHVLESLASLQGLTYPNYEVVVVGNVPQGHGEQILQNRACRGFTVIEGSNSYSFAEANNVGMRYALSKGTDYVLLLGAEMIVEPQLLDRLVEAAERDEEVGIVTPAIHSPDHPEKTLYPRQVDLWPPMLRFHLGFVMAALFRGQELACRTRPVRHMNSSAVLIKREVLESVGLFDSSYALRIYGDFDFGVRASRQGYRTRAVAEARAWRNSRRSRSLPSNSSLSSAWLHSKNRVIYARKNLPPPHFLLFLASLPLQVVLWVLIAGEKTGYPAASSAVIRGISQGFMAKLSSNKR